MDTFIKTKQDGECEREEESQVVTACDTLATPGTEVPINITGDTAADGAKGHRDAKVRPGPKSSKTKGRAAKDMEVCRSVGGSRDLSPGSSNSTLSYLSDEEILGPRERTPGPPTAEVYLTPDSPQHQRGDSMEADVPGPSEGDADQPARDRRGRKPRDPAHAGKYAGVGKARDEARKLRYARQMAVQQAEQREALKEAARIGVALRLGGSSSSQSDRPRSKREERSDARAARGDPRRRSAGQLTEQVNSAMGVVEEVAKSSRNLKGTFVRDLKEAASDAKEATDELHRRVLEGGDADGLRAELAQMRLDRELLKNEVLQLRATVEALKERLAAVPVRGQSPAPCGLSSTTEAEGPQAPLPQRKLGKRRHVGGHGPASPPTRGDTNPLPSAGPAPKKAASAEDILEGIVERRGSVMTTTTAPPTTEPDTPPVSSAAAPAPTSPVVRGRRGGPKRATVRDDPMSRIEALLERRLGDLRREILEQVRPKPSITRVETIAPPGGQKGGHRVSLLRPADPYKGSQPKGGKGKKGGKGVPSRPHPPPPPPPSKRQQRAARAAAPTAAPPPPATTEIWSQVVGRKAKRGAAKAARAAAAPPVPAPQVPRRAGALQGAGQRRPATGKPGKAKLPRAPAASAITLTRPDGCPCTLDRAMQLLKAAIRLGDFGIEGLRPKRAATGALLMEVPGEGGAEKAARLASRFAEVLDGTGIKVARPIKRVEMRVSALSDDATREEVLSSLAKAGDCPEGDLRVGDIRSSPSGLGTVWAQAPLGAARRIAAASEKRTLVVGWSLARAEVLAQRPLQCYKCLEVGHPRQKCPNSVDRSDRCYRCGGAGHRAATCSEAPKCPLCADLGRPSGHRLGAPSCAPQPKKRRGAAAKPAPSKPKAPVKGAGGKGGDPDVCVREGGSRGAPIVGTPLPPSKDGKGVKTPKA